MSFLVAVENKYIFKYLGFKILNPHNLSSGGTITVADVTCPVET